MTTQEVSAVIQAFDEGKTIQYRQFAIGDTEAWSDCPPKHRFNLNFYSYDYRVKPEPPKPREFWIGIHRWEDSVQACISFHEGRDKPDGCDAPEILHVREVLEEASVVKP